MSDTAPQPDCIPGAPHPRETGALFGQSAAEQGFLAAFSSDRMHHAWLLTGPKGIGKATLAWRIARFLLATPMAEPDDMFGAPPPPETLDIAPDHPVARRMIAGSEPGLMTVLRSLNDRGRLRDQIVVDDIRRISGLFQLSATEGGRRVVIVDAADEMNVNAANALLKMLEEPPERAALLLISHQPSRLLPTIRSRCRTLRLHPLGPDDMAQALSQANRDPGPSAEPLAALSAGSVGMALRLMELDGLGLYAEILALLETLPRMDRARALAFAEGLAGRDASERLDLAYQLIEIALARLARTGATGRPPVIEAAPGEAATLKRLAPHAGTARAWAETAQTALARAHHGRSVNLDPGALVLDTLFKLQDTAPS